MSSRRKRSGRPWERGIDKGADAAFGRRRLPLPTCSYVEVDGLKYHSDRFYLNAPTGLPNHKIVKAPETCCGRCGEGGPPLTFDRARLVASLDLKAAIVGTYTLDPSWLSLEMPKLFPPPSSGNDGIGSRTWPYENEEMSVPTLVLHGHKGLGKKGPGGELGTQKGSVPTEALPSVRPHKKQSAINGKGGEALKGVISLDVGDWSSRRAYSGNCTHHPSVKLRVAQPQHVPSGCALPKHEASNEKEGAVSSNWRKDSASSSHGQRLTVKREYFDSGRKEVDVVHIDLDTDDDSSGCDIDKNSQASSCGRSDGKENMRNGSIKISNVRDTKRSSSDRQFSLQSPTIRSVSGGTLLGSTSLHAMEPSTDDEEETGPEHPLKQSQLGIKQEDDDEAPPEEGWMTYWPRENNASDEDPPSQPLFGKSVHLTQILPKWVPPPSPENMVDKNRPAPQDPPRAKAIPTKGGLNVDAQASPSDLIVIDSTDEEDDSSYCGSVAVQPVKGVDPLIVARRKSCQGVHHPKFFLLFEKCGSIVVIVSSSNLTRPTATDASWIQRFEPSSSSREEKVVDDETRRDGSDFGYVLADFLRRQSDAAAVGQMIPEEFLDRHLNIPSLDNFRQQFCFDKADVHLIATIPGERPGRHSSTHLGRASGKASSNGDEVRNRTYLYGPQRIADILSRLGRPCWPCLPNAKRLNTMVTTGQSRNKPWLPPHLFQDKDRLIVQTTSFGGNWTRHNLAEIARSYLGFDNREDLVSGNTKDDDVIDMVDIVWPTMGFMKIDQSHRSQDKPRNVENGGIGARSNPNNGEINLNGLDHFSFLSTQSFNTIDLPCLSRMVLYEQSVPSQLSRPTLSPHIKTFGRILASFHSQPKRPAAAPSEKGGAGADSHTQEEERFGWYMLTSACLSRGAQGKAIRHRGCESDAMVYSNFELGVLFVSRITGDTSIDRLYGWEPSRCVCNSRRLTAGHRHRSQSHLQKRTATQPRVIHLPIPYKLRPASYQNDPDEADMSETPFFHEITEGTGGVGQMRLTPFGKMLATMRGD